MNKVEFLKQYLLRDPISKNAALQALKDWDNQPLYAFLYNPMIHESGYITVSIHRTREGAEKAMEEQMTEEKKRYKEWYENDKSYKLQFPFNWNKNWKIEEIKILD
jgi:hypothetical protein